MTWFPFGKREEEEKKWSHNCACSGTTGSANPGTTGIVVLGTGCKSCHALYENAKQAVVSMGLDEEVIYVTDLQQVMAYGVMTVPALVVDGQVLSAGRILKPAEVEKLLKAHRECDAR